MLLVLFGHLLVVEKLTADRINHNAFLQAVQCWRERFFYVQFLHRSLKCLLVNNNIAVIDRIPEVAASGQCFQRLREGRTDK